MKEVESYGQEGVEVVLIGNKVDVKSEEGVSQATAGVESFKVLKYNSFHIGLRKGERNAI